MMRSHHKTALQVLRLNLTLTFVALSVVALAPVFLTKHSTVIAQAIPQLPIPAGKLPAAVIKRIVEPLPGSSPTATPSPATVTRGRRSMPVSTGLLLYIGDVIHTNENTQVTVLFLDDPVAERDNEVIIDAGAMVGISSTYSWWGRVWAKVKDTFESKTDYVSLGVKGTEYEFNVLQGQERATVVVLEGTVAAQKGVFTPALAGLEPDRIWPTANLRFTHASFAPEPFPQDEFGRALDISAGQIESLSIAYNIHTDCRQPHQYEFRTSDNTEWFQLLGDKRVQLGARETKIFTREVRIDATKLLPGLYRAHVYVVCLDCNSERNCNQAQLNFTYNVTVTGPGAGPSPSPSPSPTLAVSPTPPNQSLLVPELQESVLTRGNDRPKPVTEARALEVIDWTNNVILQTQPSYSAESLIPHFSAPEQRSRSFRAARPAALLKHEPEANKTLGDIYSDWGQSALAVFAYEKIVSRRTVATLLVDRAEAYRLTGQLSKAGLPDANANSAAAMNLRGNLALDNARIQLDKGNGALADTYLTQAQSFYKSALAAKTTAPGGAAATNVTVQTNLARTQIARGDMMLQTATPNSVTPQIAAPAAAAQTARTEYTQALDGLRGVQQPASTYPFGVKELGRAYQGIGHIAMLEGNAVAARNSYAEAKDQYFRVIAAHADCAEVYFTLGDLAEDMGDKAAARDYYARAIKTRPEQPASYYPLALLVQDENPQLAAALAGTYLKLEPAVFKQGQKALNAERMTRGEHVVPPPPPWRGVIVPNVSNQTLTDAARAITDAGLILGKTERRNDARPKDTVLEQMPAGSTKAARGSIIDLVISDGPPIEFPVPNVLRKSSADAARAIESAGFTLGRTDQRPDQSAAGTVLEQTPGGGTKAPRGSAINLIASSGPVAPSLVPNVLNQTQAVATNMIQQAGLRVGKIKMKGDNKKAPGTVVKQNPSAGKKPRSDSTVDLEVTETKPVEVPGVVDHTEESAQNDITKKGLKVGQIERRASCSPPGKVLTQNPARGARVELGTSVDLVIASLGEDPLTVPNFVGRDRRDAEGMISDKGFRLRRVAQEETDQAQDGTVLRQSPKPETKFARICPVAVDLTIAIPIVWVEVGNYVNLPLNEATRQLSALELLASVSYQESANTPAGMVMQQSPPPGTRVRHRSPVTLIVSRTPAIKMVTVPSVCGLSLAQARQALLAAGLVLDEPVTYASPNPQLQLLCGKGAEGTVFKQEPGANTKVQQGTRVKLTIAQYNIGEN